MVTFKANTVVNTIPVDDPWFDGLGDPIVLPGNGRFDSPDNMVSRRQFRQILNGARVLELGDMSLADAVDTLRDRRHANIRGAQRDFGIVDYLNTQIAAANANEDLTPGQVDYIVAQISYLSGSEVHYNDVVAAKIAQLPASRRDKLIARFEAVLDEGTQGDLTKTRKVYQAFVGDANREQALARRNAASTAQMAEELDSEVGDAETVDGDDKSF